MTTKEKAERIMSECRKHSFCSTDSWTCPLYGYDESCWETDDSTIIDRNYELLFPSGKEAPKTTNAVNHPSHYNQGGIECIDAMVAAFGKEKVCDFCIMNTFKYLWRYQHKNGFEDVKKASWYLNKYMELTEEQSNENN